jgi:hypothetical protein
MEATPVCGIWQLQVMVHNFAPAVQKVIIEQEAADSRWNELWSGFCIEFRAHAARPFSKLVREFTVPVDSPDGKLRIRVGGVGQLAVSQACLRNGIQKRLLPEYYRNRILGRPVSKQGLPSL